MRVGTHLARKDRALFLRLFGVIAPFRRTATGKSPSRPFGYKYNLLIENFIYFSFNIGLGFARSSPNCVPMRHTEVPT